LSDSRNARRMSLCAGGGASGVDGSAPASTGCDGGGGIDARWPPSPSGGGLDCRRSCRTVGTASPLAYGCSSSGRDGGPAGGIPRRLPPPADQRRLAAECELTPPALAIV
jgi:hypothetical protein